MMRRTVSDGLVVVGVLKPDDGYAVKRLAWNPGSGVARVMAAGPRNMGIRFYANEGIQGQETSNQKGRHDLSKTNATRE